MTADLKIARQITMKPDTCFDLWMHPDEVAKWWGPKDDAGRPFTATVEAWTATPGAAWAITMVSPDGRSFSQSGKILEIRRPHLFRFTFAWVENGQRSPETEIRVTFEPDGSGTRLIFEQVGFADTTTRDGHVGGWQECLDRLAALDTDAMETQE